MNDAQRGTSTTVAGADGEDLDVVLGRFRSWAAGDKKSSPAELADKPGTKEDRSSESATVSSEAREISYDQALRASRYRRQEDFFSFDPVPDAPLSVGEDRPPGGPFAKEGLTATISRWNDDEDFELKSRVSRWPEVSFVKAASAAADLPEVIRQPSAVSDSMVVPVAAAQTVEAPKSVAASAASVEAIRARARIKSSSEGPAKHDCRDASMAAEVEVAAGAAKPFSRQSRSETTFREVLKRTSAKSAPASPRSVCLTLQAADGEQARLQESAAKENLSAAVYLRQCSLTMDDLRVQLEIAMARAGKEQQDKSGAKFEGINGGLRQIGARWRRRLRRWNDDFSGLSAR